MGVQGVAWGWTCWGSHGGAMVHGVGHAGGCMGVQGSAMVENKINTAAKVHEA